MRRARIKIRGKSAVYHCVSRAVNREMLFDSVAKEVLRGQMWQVADFSGVEVITYCMMGNHFHVLVRVPDREQVSVSDEELMRRYRVLYPRPTKYQPARADVLEAILAEGGEEAEAVRAQLVARMHDVSEFMKTLKQRFTIWYNHNYGRAGTLWSERFKSTLVDGKRFALQIVAAYIDLNPVRAGIVTDPKDYRWNAYGEAVGGSAKARRGLIAAIGLGTEMVPWSEPSRAYRKYLYCKGSAPAPGNGGAGASIPVEAWRREMNRGGVIPVAAALRCRVRYFTDGAVFGSRAYVQDTAESVSEPSAFPRICGPRKMLGSDWRGLTVLQNLRGEIFG